ncbi:MAG: hypothetical protein GX410_01310 [Elusimicrobia bacterium]|nr:hypothetical protein [Elusimicrobiota bacterium]
MILWKVFETYLDTPLLIIESELKSPNLGFENEKILSRLKVTNNGVTTAKNCIIRIENIFCNEVQNGSNNNKDIEFLEPMNLRWAGTEKEHVDISPRSYYYIPLLSYRKFNGPPRLNTYNSGKHPFIGNLKFTITVYPNNAKPTFKNFKYSDAPRITIEEIL